MGYYHKYDAAKASILNLGLVQSDSKSSYKVFVMSLGYNL